MQDVKGAQFSEMIRQQDLWHLPSSEALFNKQMGNMSSHHAKSFFFCCWFCIYHLFWFWAIIVEPMLFFLSPLVICS